MRSALTLVVIAALLTGLEALAYLKGGAFSWLAARVWALMGLGFVVLGLGEIARSAAGAVRERSLVSLVMVLVAGFAALWGIGGVDHVQLQHEATQEVAWGLEALETPSWFHTRVGHLGYPGRQYLIVAAPSLVLGRSLVGLRLGFAVVFVFGVLLFWSGARLAWGDRLRGPEAAALAALSVVAFPYAVKHLHWYEQTSLPLAFTLAAAGWLLVALRRPSALNWLGLAWIGALLGTSYTPGLGSWVLLLVALVWLAGAAWRESDRSGAVARIAVAAMVAGFGGLSFISRVDLIKEPGQTMRPEPFEPLCEAFSIFFLGTPTSFIPAVLVLPILITLVLGLVGRLGAPGLAVSWWTLGVVVAAIGFAGYGVRRPDFEMHRAQIVIPPLLLLTGWAILRLRSSRSTSRVARLTWAVVCLLVVGQAFWTVTAAFRSYRPTVREKAYNELLVRAAEFGVASEEPVLLLLLTGRNEFSNSRDYLRYFFPRHTTLRSVEEAGSLDHRAGVFFVIADAKLGRTDLPAWIDRGSMTTFRHVDPHDPFAVVVWAGRRPVPGDAG